MNDADPLSQVMLEGRLPSPLTCSVALATFNGERYIGDQISSIVKQTSSPLEIVICDDGSTDSTPAIIHKIAGQSNIPIRYFENSDRLGYRANFLKAGSLCRGDIVFFSDQDDLWDLKKVQTMLPYFSNSNVLLAYHNATVFSSQGETEPRLLYVSADQERGVSPDMPIPFHFSQGFTQCYRRSLHQFDDLWAGSIDQFEPSKPLAHDQWFIFLAFLLGQVRYDNAALAHYRQHEANVFGAYAPERKWLKRSRPSQAVLREEDLGRISSCLARARIASEVNKRIGGHADHQSALISRRFETFARRTELRIRCASASRLVDRLDALKDNLRSGAYGGSELWRFDKRWLPKDILRAVFGSQPRLLPDEAY